MFLRLTKGWALVGVVAIVFGAGVLHGLLVWSSGSLIPRMIGHIVMDIGLFAIGGPASPASLPRGRSRRSAWISLSSSRAPLWRPPSLLCCPRPGGSGG